jgi:predicted alpha/beta hydrolase family esterase
MPVKRQLLFVQGGGAGAHDEWDNKLVESLSRELGPNFEIRYPLMPNEDNPPYAAWKATLEKEFAALDDHAILVGHSIGAAILANALAQSRSERKFGAIFLVAAPFVGEGGWSSQDMHSPPDLGARLPRDVPVYIYHGLDDETAPPSHADLYARAIPQARIHRLSHRDHQLNNDLSEIAATIKSCHWRGSPRSAEDGCGPTPVTELER